MFVRPCVAKTLTLDITRKVFNQFVSYLSWFLAPLSCHFYPFVSDLDFGVCVCVCVCARARVCVRWGGGGGWRGERGIYKVSAKQNRLASFSCTLFSWPGWNLMWNWSNSRWTSWYHRYHFTDCVKKFNVGIHSDFNETVWCKRCMTYAIELCIC